MDQERKAPTANARKRNKKNSNRRGKRKPPIVHHVEVNDREPEEKELDANFVNYSSSSDGENQPGSSAKRRRSAEKPQPAGQSSDSDDMSISDDDGLAEIKLASEDKQNGSDVEVTLDFYDPRADDVTVLAKFLEPWVHRLGKTAQDGNLSPSAIAERVCAQTRVGTSVRVDTDDSSPVAFISCLNVRTHADFSKPLSQFLCKRAKCSPPFAKLLKACIEGRGRFEHEKMGLLLCERVVNFPPTILPKLFEAIFCEIEWAVEDEPTQQLREEFRFGWYLYLTEVYVGKDEGDTSADGNADSDDQMGFLKAEDPAWYKQADHTVLWPLPGEDVEKGGMRRNGLAVIVAAKKVPAIRKFVEDAVDFTEPHDSGNEEVADDTP